MSAVRLRANDLIVRAEDEARHVERLIASARRGHAVRIELERSSSDGVFASAMRWTGGDASFREGCIKAVEAHIWPLAERSRVLAEIHRRIDRLTDACESSIDPASAWASVYDFAGAWALAARLIRSGLRVAVVDDAASEDAAPPRDEPADVEIVLAAGLPGRD